MDKYTWIPKKLCGALHCKPGMIELGTAFEMVV